AEGGDTRLDADHPRPDERGIAAPSGRPGSARRAGPRAARHAEHDRQGGAVTTTFPEDFLWGASTAPHQIEGNNTNSDFWANEGRVPGMERSGDACDSYHRYREDMELLADAGCTAYRFGVEWARVEPVEGLISNATLAHYRRM